MSRFILAIALASLFGCSFESPNKYSDLTIAAIADFQDLRQTDSLIIYLINKNPVYRAEAALALASVQDSTASLQLGTMLLEDPYLQARINAAFALGQIGGNAAINALIPALTDTSSKVLNEVLQSLGKTVSMRDMMLSWIFNRKIPYKRLANRGDIIMQGFVALLILSWLFV
jgi:HEAT repeats